MHAKILTGTLTCSFLLSAACGDSSASDDDTPQQCIGGQYCLGDLVCVAGYCVDPQGGESGDGDDGDGDGDDGGDGDGDSGGDGDGDSGGDGDGDSGGDGDGDGDGDSGGDGDGDGEAQVCGNGVVESGEQCDYGNDNGNDVCDNNCEWGPQTNIAFVTSQVWSGNLGGVEGGDAKCQTLADAAGLTGTYMAWLGTWNPEISPATRFTQSPYPYVLVDGTKIADDWSDLTDDSLDNPLNLTEEGAEPPDTVGFYCFDLPVVFTGTSPGGHGGGSHCNHWTSSQSFDNVSVGRRTLTTGNWSYGCSSPDCDRLAPLYCFEQ